MRKKLFLILSSLIALAIIASGTFYPHEKPVTKSDHPSNHVWFVCNGWMHRVLVYGMVHLEYCPFNPGVHSV